MNILRNTKAISVNFEINFDVVYNFMLGRKIYTLGRNWHSSF